MKIAVLALDGMRAFDVAVAMETLASDRTDRGVPRDDVVRCGPNAEVRLDHGLCLTGCRDLDLLSDSDIVIVPGFQGPQTLLGPLTDPAVLRAVDAVRAAHARGSRIVSLCSGAFFVAATGLFDGRAATTHWRYTDLLQDRYPTIRVQDNVLFVEDHEHGVASSAGVTAGIDLCLAILGRAHGTAAASAVARAMVVPAARAGGQLQYMPPRFREPELRSAGLARLSEAVRSDLTRAWTLRELAEVASMSPRTLQRVFGSAVGRSPGQWVIDERLRVTRELLEHTTIGIELLAHRVGFSTGDLLRKHFVRALGTSPSEYRKAFQLRDPA